MDGEVSIKNLSWSHVVAPLLVAVVVGIGASYVTTKVQIGTIQQRMSRVEKDVVRLRSQAERDRQSQRDINERVIRMETKLDLLLQAQGIDSEDVQ